MMEGTKVSADLYRYTEHKCQLKRKDNAPFNHGRSVGTGVLRDAGKSALSPGRAGECTAGSVQFQRSAGAAL